MSEPRLAPIAVVLVVASTALAAGHWTESLEYRYAGSTSLKVTEPEGFAISVETPDGVRTGTVPEVFSLENQDAYVTVRLTAPSGETWKKKIEMRARQQAELAVAFKPDDKPKAEDKPSEKPADKPRAYVARVLNGGAGCENKKYRAAIKTDFRRASDGESQVSLVVNDGVKQDFEIPAGTFSVRVYRYTGDAWDFAFTTEVTAPARDGAVFGYGCVNGAASPSLIVR